MFDRAALKENAKRLLRGNYWPAVLVCILAFLIGALPGNIAGIRSAFNQGPSTALNTITTIYGIFVGSVLMVGVNHYFLKMYRGQQDIADLFSNFRGESYIKTVVTMLVTSIYILLWTLLLIIPGIIKGIAYSMVPYILAENPQIGTQRAIALSEQMTKGSKGDIFVMYLSFIGWALLGFITCGIGFLFLEPYVDASFAGLYYQLKANAFANGIVEQGELPF